MGVFVVCVRIAVYAWVLHGVVGEAGPNTAAIIALLLMYAEMQGFVLKRMWERENGRTNHQHL
jgi:hypothetical protein